MPPNAGPRTLDYAALFAAAISTTNQANMKVFAGNVDDPAWADAGAFFDSVSLLTRTGAVEAASSTAATLGVWGTTSRLRLTARRAPLPSQSSGPWSQIDRRGNALVRELLIGSGFADRFAMDQPKNDSQFASFFLDPSLARVLNAATGGVVPIPTPPRLPLLPLLTYSPPSSPTTSSATAST